MPGANRTMAHRLGSRALWVALIAAPLLMFMRMPKMTGEVIPMVPEE